MNDKTQSKTMDESIRQEKIRRAMLAGPSCLTKEATVAEMAMDGSLSVLRAGTNEWIACPATRTSSGRQTCAWTRWAGRRSRPTPRLA